ncbi:MAG: PD-(D/E)XK nuclease family protein, partial [Phycisphaerales bacterium]
SATKLATFAACPFKHFGRYSLELKPRREFKLEPLDLGNFYHAVLDALHKHLAVEGRDFADVDDDRLIQLLHERIEDFASTDPFISKFRSRSDHNAFIISNASEVLGECVLEIAQMARAGAFRPLLSEAAFGDVRTGEESLGQFELPLPEGGVLTLSGKIDRIDVAEIEGRRVALVFDYKRTESATTFKWSQFYHGLNIQLPMYLLALSEMAEAPVDGAIGAFCMPIERAPASAALDDLAQKADRFGRKAKGLFDGAYAQQLDPDPGSRWSQFYNFGVTNKDQQYGYYANSGALKPDDFQRVLEFARNKMIALAAEIMGGQVAVHPYRLGTQVACSHCDFKAVCRFDWQVNDYHFLEPKSKLDVIGECNGA